MGEIHTEDITMACPSCGTFIDTIQQRDTGCDYCVEDEVEDIHEQKSYQYRNYEED
jgi:hypothetical protein